MSIWACESSVSRFRQGKEHLWTHPLEPTTFRCAHPSSSPFFASSVLASLASVVFPAGPCFTPPALDASAPFAPFAAPAGALIEAGPAGCARFMNFRPRVEAESGIVGAVAEAIGSVAA